MTPGTKTTRLTWKMLDPQAPHLRAEAAAAVTPGWAWDGSSGAGVRVCLLDSGIEPDHPLVGRIASAHAVRRTGEALTVVEAEPGDVFGHGTACASIIRRVAPDCEIHSLRVLDEAGRGMGDALLAGLAWAVEQGFDVVNLSLSTPRPEYSRGLRELADDAFFRRTVIVASAHNSPIESFPWRFSSVISVGSHAFDDSSLVLYNPRPPVEFFARGQRVPVAALGGTQTLNTGNSFATPHITGLIARILAKHPDLTAFELKTILYWTCANVSEVASAEGSGPNDRVA